MYDVREIHHILEEDYIPYTNNADFLIHESMNLYPVYDASNIDSIAEATRIKQDKVFL